MTETKTKNDITVRTLLKKPDLPPRIVNISFTPDRKSVKTTEIRETVRDVLNLQGSDTPVEECDYNSLIKMYYADKGTYNFGIGYQFFMGNVLFLKVKDRGNNRYLCPCNLTDFEIKRIIAAMGWQIRD